MNKRANKQFFNILKIIYFSRSLLHRSIKDFSCNLFNKSFLGFWIVVEFWFMEKVQNQKWLFNVQLLT